jgi:light-regulated signal transduction histidine kinase (bacteriophytochrome)
MTVDVDLTACDREPIHVPGSIQPHGVMLVADSETLTVTHAAGDLEAFGWATWQGVPLVNLIGQAAVETTRRTVAGGIHFIGQIQAPTGALLDATAHPSSGQLIVELEPAPAKPLPATALLAAIEVAGMALEQSNGMQMLCERGDRVPRPYRLRPRHGLPVPGRWSWRGGGRGTPCRSALVSKPPLPQFRHSAAGPRALRP